MAPDGSAATESWGGFTVPFGIGSQYSRPRRVALRTKSPSQHWPLDIAFADVLTPRRTIESAGVTREPTATVKRRMPHILRISSALASDSRSTASTHESNMTRECPSIRAALTDATAALADAEKQGTWCALCERERNRGNLPAREQPSDGPKAAESAAQRGRECARHPPSPPSHSRRLVQPIAASANLPMTGTRLRPRGRRGPDRRRVPSPLKGKTRPRCFAAL